MPRGRHTTRPPPWPGASYPSAIGCRGAAAGLGFLGWANALLMSAKTFEMANGGGGGGRLCGRRRLEVTRLAVWRVGRRVIVTPPTHSLNLMSLSPSYLETGMFSSKLHLSSAPMLFSWENENIFFSPSRCCEQGRVWAYAGLYVRHAAARATFRHRPQLAGSLSLFPRGIQGPRGFILVRRWPTTSCTLGPIPLERPRGVDAMRLIRLRTLRCFRILRSGRTFRQDGAWLRVLGGPDYPQRHRIERLKGGLHESDPVFL